MKQRTFGFSLIEMMVTLVISSIVLLGVSYTHSITSGAIYTTKNIQKSQEVLRYTYELFARSLKQTEVMPRIPEPGTLVVEHTQVGVMACNGSKPGRAFTETYRLEGNELVCQIDSGVNLPLISGIKSIQYRVTGNLVEISVIPEHWMKELLPEGFRIDIAMTSQIFGEMMGG